MLCLYVLRLSMFCLSVVRVLAVFLLSRSIRVMGNVLRNSSILESTGSTQGTPTAHGTGDVGFSGGMDLDDVHIQSIYIYSIGAKVTCGGGGVREIK